MIKKNERRILILSIYYTDKKPQPSFMMSDIVSILGRSADFDKLKLHICKDIEATARAAAEEADLNFDDFRIDLSSAMQYIQENDDQSEELEGIMYKHYTMLYKYFIHTGISFHGLSWTVYCVCLRINRQDPEHVECYSKVLNSWTLYEQPCKIQELPNEYEAILVAGTAESDFLGCILDNFGSIPPEIYIFYREAYKNLIDVYIKTKGFMKFTVLPITDESTEDNTICRIGLEPRNPLISGIAISENEGHFTLHAMIRPGHGNGSPFDSLDERLLYEKKANCCYYQEIDQTDDKQQIETILAKVADCYLEDMTYRVPLSIDFFTEANSVEELGFIIKSFDIHLERHLTETETENSEKIAEFAAIAAMDLEEAKES